MSVSSPSDPTKSREFVKPNPFPASPIARLVDGRISGVDVATPASIQAKQYADEYTTSLGLDRFADVANGRVLAIIGEYGTGKTHLAMQVMNQIEDATGPLTSLYLDAPADSFLALYKERFLIQLERAEVRKRITAYYVDIVAAELEHSELTMAAAKSLRAGNKNVDAYVRSIGLMEDELRRTLDIELSNVAENKDFGRALSLLLRPEYEAAVWEWLSGKAPDSSLIERGIERSIDSDAAALEALGVFAFIFGRSKTPLLLIIDELEKVLSPGSLASRNESSVLAFKKLLEVFVKTNGFLILCGLPEMIDALPKDAVQRIGMFVRPTSLTADDTIQYLLQSNNASQESEGLRPFSRDVIEYIVDLAGGNTRRLLRLCHHVYHTATGRGAEVTRALVREVARDQFELSTHDDAKATIVRLLNANGWIYDVSKLWGQGSESVVSDFWVPVSDEGPGCSIVVSQSILEEVEATELIKLGQRIAKNAPPSSLSLLVVNGYLAENVIESLKSGFDKIINYSGLDFAEDLESLVKGMRISVEAGMKEDTLALIRERVEQLTRQNGTIRGLLDSISDRTLSPSVIRAAVKSGVDPSVRERAFGSALYDQGLGQVEELFLDTRHRIERLIAVADRLIGAYFVDFTNPKSYSARRKSNRQPLRLSSAEMQFFDEIAKVRSVLIVMDAFRLAVEDILLDHSVGSMIASALRDKCQAYDTIMVGHLESVDWDFIFSTDWRSWPVNERPRSMVETTRPDLSLPDDLRLLARSIYDQLVRDYE